ncbi:MAG: hypothetical protein FJ387_19405 [Verrucomicrobia bacterium]|nr:hypothetical protein [Verrucomicrobiota bacterium]
MKTLVMLLAVCVCGSAWRTQGAARELAEALALVDVAALERAVEDLALADPATCGARRVEWLGQLAKYGSTLAVTREGVRAGDARSLEQAERLVGLQREILLSNPLLRTFDEVLLVRRAARGDLGLPANWEGNSSLRPTGWDNEIGALSLRHLEAPRRTVYRPEGKRFVGDLHLHYEADRLLFSQGGRNGRWQVFELELAGGAPVELPLIIEPDVDNYDACYLPDDDIIFTSTAPFIGVPCVTGASHVANLYRYDRATGKIRRLTFDQEHNWGPVVLPSGRVMYTRWEYSDLPHFVARLVFAMNPDGTGQTEHYGSGSYWPNATFYARPIPGQATMFVGIVSGHHGVRRMGELVLFDPARGRHEARGVVQRIPGYGQVVQPVIRDHLVDESWPKFLHPWPLSEKYFLVSAQPTPQSAWGIYLVDVFDNLLLLREEPGAVLFEPVALQRRPVPPLIPSRVKDDDPWATLFIADLYSGPGLAGVPRGTVKRLRLLTYHFAYQGMGGQVNRVGLDGPWDIKRVLGTVPVEPDGSALFRVPANTPISMQPLDERGRALARMRSWTTAMPGEFQSCGGCHEPQNRAALNRVALASHKPPAEIAPWYGPVRGFSFNREVQPVLDRYCVGCHHGLPRGVAPDLTLRPDAEDEVTDPTYRRGSRFPPAYQALRCFVRSGPAESDMHVLPPAEFHASTIELVQTLEQGHYGVELDAEAWDRLYTWIDLGTPAHGTWQEIVGEQRVAHQRQRRLAMLDAYAGPAEDGEAIHPTSTNLPAPLTPPAPSAPAAASTTEPVAAWPQVEGWPFDHAEAVLRQHKLGPALRTVELGGGVTLELVRIPAGAAVLGDGDRWPLRPVRIERPFWMGRFEVSNEQYGCFDAAHDSRLEHSDFLHFNTEDRGYPLNGPTQPVCRVSWHRAQAFCRWLSEQTGSRFALPTQDQWEYACRAGTAAPFWFGGDGTAFARSANLADVSFRRTKRAYQDRAGRPAIVPEWRPAIVTVDDGYRVAAPVGSYQANPWGLHDLHGNVWEWTQSVHPLAQRQAEPLRLVCGGSWSDRPKRATASARLWYAPWQVIYNVGFRVVCEDSSRAHVASR